MSTLGVAAGDTVGEYLLDALLGEGATGAVYRAHRAQDPTPIALKIFATTGDASASLRRRMHRECELLSSIRHPGVVRILEVGVDREPPFLAMEHVPGTTLRDRLVQGPLEGVALAAAGSQLLAALGALHAKGILHRDVTPANAILAGDRLVLVDFGLAHLVDEATITRKHGIVATLAYAPPERLRQAAATERSDLYQAALVLYETATGSRAFGMTDAGQLATAQLLAQPARASAIRPGLPHLLDQFFDRALRKDPAERYPDATAMGADWSFLMGLHGACRA